MPRSSGKKKRSSRLSEATALSSLNPLRTGMPALDSILSVRTLQTSEAAAVAESLRVPSYRIIRTNEVDGYEKAATSICVKSVRLQYEERMSRAKKKERTKASAAARPAAPGYAGAKFNSRGEGDEASREGLPHHQDRRNR